MNAPARPIDTPSALAAELVDLAERCASLPAEARMLLGLAARVYRETGEPDLAIQCEWTAAHIRAATAKPRSRPFVPSVAEAEERRRVADPAYVPTLDEALRHPDAFVEGMTETAGEVRLGTGRCPSDVLAPVSGRGRRS
jgi:ParB-like chromosome segregation protein Spo0J